MTLHGSQGPLLSSYDALFVDLDGVVYRGAGAVPYAVETIAAVRAAALRVAFVTNNASRTPAVVAAHLSEIGVPARADEVVTSAQAAVTLVGTLVEPGAAVLVVGGDGLRNELDRHGFRMVASADEAPAAVLQGYAADTTVAQLAEAALAIRAGAAWVAANLDATLPTARGQVPGNGALVAALRTATGREPHVAGKPGRALHDEAVRRTGARRPLVVGDRLDSDVAGAVRAGVPSLLVMTGVADPDTLLRARTAERPSYVGADLRSLLRAHPAPSRDAEGAVQCGGWTAHDRDGALRVEGAATPDDDGLDALRALAVVAWQRADEGGAVDDVVAAWRGLTAGCAAAADR